MAAANRPDYIVAKTLPYMQLVHEDGSSDRWKHFTVDEARQMYVDGLPLLMNHNDGDDGGKLIEVGQVRASAVKGAHAKVLATIEPRRSEAATLASNRVATGLYPSVSLGHQVDVNIRAALDSGAATYTKTPREVSLCKKGARFGSTIDVYCPGRTTLERLAADAPEDLAKLVERHGYGEALIDMGVSATDGERYIEALATLSDSRLAEVIEREGLRPRAPPPPATTHFMTSNAGTPPAKVQASDASAPPADAQPPAAAAATETQQQPPAASTSTETAAPPAQQQQQQQQQAPPASQEQQQQQPNRSIETPSTGGGVDGSIAPHEWAKLAVEAGKESKAHAEALAEERRKNAELVTKLERAAHAEAQLAAEKAEREAKEKEKRKEELESVIKSLRQYGAAGGIAKDTIEEQIMAAREYEQSNPDVSMKMLQQAHTLAVHASDERKKHQEEKGVLLHNSVENFNKTFLDSQAREWHQLRSETANLSRAAVPPTALSTRFEQPPQQAPATSPTPSMPTGASSSSTDSQSPPQRKRAYADYVETAAPPHFTVRASEDKFPVGELRADYMKATGKHPSYSDLAYGVHFEATGKVQMSADGCTEEPVVNRKRLRRTPAHISPWNYAPAFAASLEKAMEQVSSNVRGASSMQMRMVEQGPKF